MKTTRLRWIHPHYLCSVVSAVVIFMVVSSPAQAYVDPNAGGLLFQILTPVLGVIAAAGVALRTKLAGLFSKLTGKNKK